MSPFIKFYKRPDDCLQLEPKRVVVNKYMKPGVCKTVLIYVIVVRELRLIFQIN